MTELAGYVVHEDDCPFEGPGVESSERVVWRTLLSGDRAPTSKLTMGVVDLAPSEARDLRVHRHAHAEAYYVLSGSGRVSIDGVVHEIRAGHAIHIPGSTLHGAICTGDEPMRILYVFPADSFSEIEYEFPSL